MGDYRGSNKGDCKGEKRGGDKGGKFFLSCMRLIITQLFLTLLLTINSVISSG